MAAFVHRGMGRVGLDVGNTVTATASGTYVSVGSRTITAGAVGTSAGGFVLVTGTADASKFNPTNCPCLIRLFISDGTILSQGRDTILPGVADESGNAYTALADTWVFPIAAGQTKTFTLRAAFVDANVGFVNFRGVLTALYVPFGPTGTNN
jgi:hypothetical protein